jgi:hypothetical protein
MRNLKFLSILLLISVLACKDTSEDLANPTSENETEAKQTPIIWLLQSASGRDCKHDDDGKITSEFEWVSKSIISDTLKFNGDSTLRFLTNFTTINKEINSNKEWNDAFAFRIYGTFEKNSDSSQLIITNPSNSNQFFLFTIVKETEKELEIEATITYNFHANSEGYYKDEALVTFNFIKKD